MLFRVTRTLSLLNYFLIFFSDYKYRLNHNRNNLPIILTISTKINLVVLKQINDNVKKENIKAIPGHWNTNTSYFLYKKHTAQVFIFLSLITNKYEININLSEWNKNCLFCSYFNVIRKKKKIRYQELINLHLCKINLDL